MLFNVKKDNIDHISDIINQKYYERIILIYHKKKFPNWVINITNISTRSGKGYMMSSNDFVKEWHIYHGIIENPFLDINKGKINSEAIITIVNHNFHFESKKNSNIYSNYHNNYFELLTGDSPRYDSSSSFIRTYVTPFFYNEEHEILSERNIEKEEFSDIISGYSTYDKMDKYGYKIKSIKELSNDNIIHFKLRDIIDDRTKIIYTKESDKETDFDRKMNDHELEMCGILSIIIGFTHTICMQYRIYSLNYILSDRGCDLKSLNFMKNDDYVMKDKNTLNIIYHDIMINCIDTVLSYTYDTFDDEIFDIYVFYSIYKCIITIHVNNETTTHTLTFSDTLDYLTEENIMTN